MKQIITESEYDRIQNILYRGVSYDITPGEDGHIEDHNDLADIANHFPNMWGGTAHKIGDDLWRITGATEADVTDAIAQFAMIDSISSEVFVVIPDDFVDAASAKVGSKIVSWMKPSFTLPRIGEWGAQIELLKSRATSLEADVSTLTADKETLEGKVSTLESDSATLNTTVSTLEGNVTTLTSDKEALEGQVSTLESTIGDLTSRLEVANGLQDTTSESRIYRDDNGQTRTRLYLAAASQWVDADHLIDQMAILEQRTNILADIDLAQELGTLIARVEALENPTNPE